MTMHEHLAQIPAAPERISQVQLIGAPHNMARRVKGSHIRKYSIRALLAGQARPRHRDDVVIQPAGLTAAVRQQSAGGFGMLAQETT